MIESVLEALQRGFHKETVAYVKYLVFSQKAREEAKTAATEEQKIELLKAADLFRHMADDEFKHAYFYLNAVGDITTTAQHLEIALKAELNDHIEYTISASAAQAGGMDEIGRQFMLIASTEKNHAQLIQDLSAHLQDLWFDGRMKLIESRPEE
jgi:rubrerythrin